MLSSLNSYGGLSTANILMLFGASASSSSNSASSSATQSASPTGAASDANDPIATIKAILAQSQIVAGAGSADIETVAAAYAAQAGSSGVAGAAVATSSQGAAPDAGDTEITSGSSLVVGTANGLESVTTGNGPQAVSTLSAQAVEAYQFQSGYVQDTLAAATNTPLAAASNATSDSSGNATVGQSVLALTITVESSQSGSLGPDGNAQTYLDTDVNTLTQQLVSSFENNTLSPNSTPATGFSYVGTDGGATIVITGIEASYVGSAPITQTINQEYGGNSMADFMTSVAEGNEDYFADGSRGVIIPLGNS